MAARNTLTPYVNADCSTLSGTTWVAVITATDAAPASLVLIEGTCDKPIEFGFVAGTGATAAFYRIGVTTLLLEMQFSTTLYVRKLAGGTTPTASTTLFVSAWGSGG